MIHLQLARALCVDGLPGGPRPLAGPDAALLAWLALEGPTPRNRLAALLWPDKPLETARNSLRQRLFQLRRALGVDLVDGDARQLALAAGVTHDLAESDEVLEGAAAGIDGEFAQWLALQRERRRARVRRSLTELAAMAEAARDWDDALVHAGELLALEPLSEEAHRRVMRLHYLAGDRAAALLAFDRCERLLKDEVGAQPSAETVALLATIEREAAGSGLVARPAVPAAVLRPPRVVGRDAELRLLRQALDDGVTVLLSGEAGSGKSRLLAELGAAAGRRLVGVGARPGDALVPYVLAARLLRALLAVDGVRPAEPQRAELARVLPEFGTPPSRAPGEVLARLVAAIEPIVAQAGASGVAAVAVDDLQFADAASVELLQAVVGSAGVGWVVALRPAELPPAAQALVARHEAASGTLRVELQPLAVEAVSALLEQLGLPGIGGTAQAAALHRRTGGNPLYLLETLKAVLEARSAAPDGPTGSPAAGAGLPGAAPAWPRADSVQRLIQQRLARLGPLALKVARCAAVAGADLSAPLVAQVLGLRPLDLADAWAELEAAEVLVDGGFAHDLIAEAALASVPRAIARPLHAEVAAWLDTAGGEPGRIAAHWLAAGEPRRAAPALRAAARRADAALRKDEAAALHAQAAELLEAAGERSAAFDAWFGAAHAMSEATVDARIGQWADRLDALAAGDADRGYAGLVRIVALVEARRFDAAQALVVELLPLATRCGLRDLQGELHWDLTALHWERRELADAARHAEACLAALQGLDDGETRFPVGLTRRKAVAGLGMILTATGRYDAAVAHLDDAFRRCCEAGDWSLASTFAYDQADLALVRGDLAGAREWSERAMSFAQEGSFDHVHVAENLRSHALASALAGELGEALRSMDRAVAESSKGWTRGAVSTQRAQAWLWAELGRRDLALRQLDGLARRDDLLPGERLSIDATRLYAGDPGVDAAALLAAATACEDFQLRAKALCQAQDGCDAEAVLPLLAACATTAREQGAHGLWLGLQGARIAALLRLGRADEAREQALATWHRAEQGLVGVLPFPRLAAPLCAALAPTDFDLAQAIALRASAWIQRAGASLPQPWRDSYLRRARAPVLGDAAPPVRLPRG
jgi:DNA-binding SARP family transcriptional activator/tetratricopeptide (TPR) repeat protein